MKLEKGRFVNLSGQSYSTVVIPPVSVISKKALTRLKKFKESGGRVIFLGQGLKTVVDKTFRDAIGPADISWAIQEPSGKLTATVLEALPQPDFTIDQPCKSIKYLHRHWKDAEFYFVFNESDQPQKRKVTLTGKGQVQFWDGMTGQIENVSGIVNSKNGVEIEIALEPWETRSIIVGGKVKL